MNFTTESIKRGVDAIHSNINIVGEELNELDGKIGDGDLGVTLINGFNNLQTIKNDRKHITIFVKGKHENVFQNDAKKNPGIIECSICSRKVYFRQLLVLPL